jgi:hypothetical protein
MSTFVFVCHDSSPPKVGRMPDRRVSRGRSLSGRIAGDASVISPHAAYSTPGRVKPWRTVTRLRISERTATIKVERGNFERSTALSTATVLKGLKRPRKRLSDSRVSAEAHSAVCRRRFFVPQTDVSEMNRLAYFLVHLRIPHSAMAIQQVVLYGRVLVVFRSL